MSRIARTAAAFALVAALGAGARAEDAAERPLLPITFDRYYDAGALRAALERMHAAFPEWTRLESMGDSREGRPLWVLTVFDPAGPPPEDRPAMWVDGNTHGNEAQGTEVCLFAAKYALERRAEPWLAALLRRATLHFAPCVNPDGRERFLHAPNDEHSPRRVLRPVDDDRDGRADEDGPDDLDGDGEILLMRVEDPRGDLVAEEADDRLMRPARPGEQGRWRLLGSEGTDEDGDGLVNEDGPGGVDANRNWPSDWRPEPQQGGAGPFPLSEPETRATALWILGHPRIAGVQSFHNAGQMILRPPAARTDREVDFPAEDRALYDELARRGQVLLPGYRYLQIREGLYTVHGGFLEWTAHALGAVSFTNELWGPFGWGTGVVGGAKEALAWNDIALHGQGFVRWRKVAHPTLGPVELGGWRRFTVRSTPVDFLPDLCLRNALFVLEHAAALPDLRVAATREDDGRRVRVTVRNDGMLPTTTVWAQRHGLLPPDEVDLEGQVVHAAVELRGPGESPVPLTVREGRARLAGGIPGMGMRVVDLYVEPVPAGVRVRVSSRHGGLHRTEAR